VRYDAERTTGPVASSADDARKLLCGKQLRRWHLDELGVAKGSAPKDFRRPEPLETTDRRGQRVTDRLRHNDLRSPPIGYGKPGARTSTVELPRLSASPWSTTPPSSSCWRPGPWRCSAAAEAEPYPLARDRPAHPVRYRGMVRPLPHPGPPGRLRLARSGSRPGTWPPNRPRCRSAHRRNHVVAHRECRLHQCAARNRATRR
jgi:hypothetical protein